MPRQIIKHNQSGFTLIELLFLVAIIGVIVSISLNSLQQRTDNQKVEKTALQMQQIVQAAINYFTDNQCWPNAPECNQNVPSFQTYLPVGSATNPWGNAYSYQEDPNNIANFIVKSGVTATAALANRVMALLPNASIDTNDPKQAVTQTTAKNIQTYLITNIQESSIANNGSVVHIAVTCPNNWLPYATGIPNRIEPDFFKSEPLILMNCPLYYGPGNKLISNLSTSATSCNQVGQSGGNINYDCFYSVNFTANVTVSQGPPCVWFAANAGQITFNTIGYCISRSVSENEAKAIIQSRF